MVTGAFARLKKSGMVVEGLSESIKGLAESICFQLSDLEGTKISPSVSAELYSALKGTEGIESIR